MACGRRFCCVGIPYHDLMHDTMYMGHLSLLCCGVGERTFLLACLARIAPEEAPPCRPDSLSARHDRSLTPSLFSAHLDINDLRWWPSFGILSQPESARLSHGTG